MTFVDGRIRTLDVADSLSISSSAMAPIPASGEAKPGRGAERFPDAAFRSAQDRAGQAAVTLFGGAQVRHGGQQTLADGMTAGHDNFEWIFGYGQQLGRHCVDRETFVRTPKPSAGVYSAIVRANGVGQSV